LVPSGDVHNFVIDQSGETGVASFAWLMLHTPHTGRHA
jgi:hypothetical protein